MGAFLLHHEALSPGAWFIADSTPGQNPHRGLTGNTGLYGVHWHEWLGSKVLRDNGNAASIAYRIPLGPSRLTFTTHRNVYIIQDPKTDLCASNRFEEQTCCGSSFLIRYSVVRPSSRTIFAMALLWVLVSVIIIGDYMSRP